MVGMLDYHLHYALMATEDRVRDTIRRGEDFYPTDMVECIQAAVHRVLSRGGRAGFVHRHIADTTRYAGIGVIAADQNLYGRLYVSGNGRGILYSN